MIRAVTFSDGKDLNYYFEVFDISREEIIDIKWACTNHTCYGILIFEKKDI